METIIFIIIFILGLFIYFAFLSNKEKNEQSKDKPLDPLITPEIVKCPKCNSTQIQLVPKRWSLLTGFLTNKVDRICLNCKHKF